VSKEIFIGIPVLNRLDLLKQAVAAIDVPARILVVNNNSVDSKYNDEFDKWAEQAGVEVRRQRYNLGVAASWNLIIQTGLGWGYDEIYIGSNDTVVDPGLLSAVRDVDKSHPDDAMWHIWAWNFWCIHARAVSRVGLFDENFYPAYREDQDYSYRCDILAKMKRYSIPALAMPGLPQVDIDPALKAFHAGSMTVKSDKVYARHNKNTHGNWNTTHYKLKWGGLPPNEQFVIPYDGKYGEDKDHRWWPDPGKTIAPRDWDNGKKRLR